MNFKKFGMGISIVAAFGLLACDGNTSSSPEVNDSVESSTSVESENPNSSNDGVSSSSNDDVSSSSVVEEVAQCTFEATDNKWVVTYKGNDGSNSANIKTVFEIDGDNLVIRDTVDYTGSTSRLFCNLAGSETTSNSSLDSVFAFESFCEGGSSVVQTSAVSHMGFFKKQSREDFHAAVKKACDVAVNGGSYDVIPLSATTTCDFTIDDEVWSYSYLDEGWKTDSVAVTRSVFKDTDGKFLNLYSSLLPMPYFECLTQHFATLSDLRYCSAEGRVQLSSGGVTGEKEEVFDATMKTCKDLLPEVEETPVDETPVDETPVDETPVDETPVDETPVDETPVEMVSCDISGIFAECIEYPVGHEKAGALADQCESLLEGILGTGCPK